MKSDEKNTSASGPQASAPGALLAIGSGGGDHGEASPRGSTVEGPRHRHPRNWGRDVRDAEDEASGARRRVAGSRARSSLSEFPPTSPWYRAKKKTLSSADARGKRAVGSVRRSNQARARRETTVVGCRSKPPPCARVPSSASRATARFPATAPRDVGPSDGREPPSGRACQISPMGAHLGGGGAARGAHGGAEGGETDGGDGRHLRSGGV